MHKAACVLLTGPAGAGKSTVAQLVARELDRTGVPVEVLDDGALTERLGSTGSALGDLDRLFWFADRLRTHGVTVLVAADVPTRATRGALRERFEPFVEVFVDHGHQRGFEEPIAAEVRVLTHDRDARASAAQVVSYLERAGLVAVG